MRRAIWYILVAATTVVILLLLWQFGIAIVLFLLSLALAAALRPSINSIAGKKFSRRFALAAVYFSLIAIILISLLWLSQPFFQDLQKATDDFFTGYEQIIVKWPLEGTMFQQALAERLPPPEELSEALTSESGNTALYGIFGVAQNFLNVIGNIAIVIVLSLYWSADQFRFERLGLSLLPDEQHPTALRVWRSVEVGVGTYLRNQFVRSLLTGFLLGIGFSAMGLSYPTLLALGAALISHIPWFGPLITIILPFFVGLGVSPEFGLLAAAYALGVLLFLRLVLEPRFIKTQQYNTLLILLFVIALLQLFGFIGAMLAPLAAVTVQLLFQQVYRVPPPAQEASNELLEKAEVLRTRLHEVRDRLNASLPPKTAVVIDRMERLLTRAIDYIQEY
jgi:predicted PurR-regulated permease PerM